MTVKCGGVLVGMASPRSGRADFGGSNHHKSSNPANVKHLDCFGCKAWKHLSFNMVYLSSLHPLDSAGGILCGWESVVRASAGHHKSCREATCTCDTFRSWFPFTGKVRTSWDMFFHEDAHFLCLDGAVALATTSKLAVYRFQLHLQAKRDGDVYRMWILWMVMNGVHRECRKRNMDNHRVIRCNRDTLYRGHKKTY